MVQDKIDKLCQRARQAIEARDWDKAKQVYLLALGLKSDLPDVHYGLATVYFALRELTSAAHHFREVTRLDPLRAGAHINLGAVLNLLGQFDESLAALRRGLQLDPQRFEGFYNLGLVYRRKGQTDLAIDAYREALRLNPHMGDAHLNLANLYYDKAQYRMAVKHYKQALQVRPDWEKALDGLARTEAALTGESLPEAKTPSSSGIRAAIPANELERVVDPQSHAEHAELLNTLHRTAGTSEEIGRLLEKVLLEKIEPTVKALSSTLLQPDSTRTELDECIRDFEMALQELRDAQGDLRKNISRLRALQEHYPNVGAAPPSEAGSR